MEPFEIVQQTPRKGPGRPPKKRGPGRPPKRKPEDAPDYCPEFLEPALFIDTKPPVNKQNPAIFHYIHIEPHHTCDPSGSDIVQLPNKTIHKLEVIILFNTNLLKLKIFKFNL